MNTLFFDSLFLWGVLAGSSSATLILGTWLWYVYGLWQEEQRYVSTLEAEKHGLTQSLEVSKYHASVHLQTLQQAQQALENAAQAACAKVMSTHQDSFFKLAQETLGNFQGTLAQTQQLHQMRLTGLMEPLAKALHNLDSQVHAMEQARVGAYEGIKQHLSDLMETQQHLRQETARLSQAIANPKTRGRWGEIQLKRVIELAGMLPHCDFLEQGTFEKQDNTRVRPDVVIHLPEKRQIVVDAKVPLSSYLEALEACDEVSRQQKWADHAKQLRQHIKSLSNKQYWDYVGSTADFVILFLPHEAFLTVALEQDAALMEMAGSCQVMLATPMTLIALLKVIAFGWSQVTVMEQAQSLHQYGQDLGKHLTELMAHTTHLGRHLGQAVRTYNTTVQHMNDHVGTCLSHLQELGLVAQKTQNVRPITLAPLEKASLGVQDTAGFDKLLRDPLK